MRDALKRHWPEYLMEAAGLGLFMISAAVFGTLLEHPSSPVHAVLPDPLIRRILMGLAMGLTAIGIIYSPWGRQSGAHLNPAVTLTFWRLGKIESADALFYALSQFLGGLTGMLLIAGLIGPLLAHMHVHYVATVPGPRGPAPAFLVETFISFFLMTMVLICSNQRRLARATGLIAGILVASYVILAAPVSGFSMNPARSFASAVPAHVWTAFWIYFLAPPLGMLLAAECYLRLKGAHEVYCAKLNHFTSRRCIFKCAFAGMPHAAPKQLKVEERQIALSEEPGGAAMMFSLLRGQISNLSPQ
jgi:aquaporin Z